MPFKMRQLRGTHRFLHDALVETSKLFVRGAQTQGLVRKKVLHSKEIYSAKLLLRSLTFHITVIMAGMNECPTCVWHCPRVS
jgi:hypothetical protein